MSSTRFAPFFFEDLLASFYDSVKSSRPSSSCPADSCTSSRFSLHRAFVNFFSVCGGKKKKKKVEKYLCSKPPRWAAGPRSQVSNQPRRGVTVGRWGHCRRFTGRHSSCQQPDNNFPSFSSVEFLLFALKRPRGALLFLQQFQSSLNHFSRMQFIFSMQMTFTFAGKKSGRLT